MLSDDERTRFAEIADILIPHAEGMPSASEADVVTRWIDDALGYRPDLVDLFHEALAVGADLEPAEALELLNTDHSAAFEALGTLTAGSYFLNPEIRTLIGYPGQLPTLPRNDVDTYIDLLEHVAERGQVYRDVE
jgi:hypothetical protein